MVWFHDHIFLFFKRLVTPPLWWDPLPHQKRNLPPPRNPCTQPAPKGCQLHGGRGIPTLARLGATAAFPLPTQARPSAPGHRARGAGLGEGKQLVEPLQRRGTAPPARGSQAPASPARQGSGHQYLHCPAKAGPEPCPLLQGPCLQLAGPGRALPLTKGRLVHITNRNRAARRPHPGCGHGHWGPLIAPCRGFPASPTSGRSHPPGERSWAAVAGAAPLGPGHSWASRLQVLSAPGAAAPRPGRWGLGLRARCTSCLSPARTPCCPPSTEGHGPSVRGAGVDGLSSTGGGVLCNVRGTQGVPPHQPPRPCCSKDPLCQALSIRPLGSTRCPTAAHTLLVQ